MRNGLFWRRNWGREQNIDIDEFINLHLDIFERIGTRMDVKLFLCAKFSFYEHRTDFIIIKHVRHIYKHESFLLIQEKLKLTYMIKLNVLSKKLNITNSLYSCTYISMKVSVFNHLIEKKYSTLTVKTSKGVTMNKKKLSPSSQHVRFSHNFSVYCHTMLRTIAIKFDERKKK